MNPRNANSVLLSLIAVYIAGNLPVSNAQSLSTASPARRAIALKLAQASTSRPVIPGRVTNNTAVGETTASSPATSGAQPKAHGGYTAPNFLVTTTSNFENYQIVQYRGIVVGASVREPTWSENAAAGAQEPYGGSLDAYAQLCEEARQQAFTTLVNRARETGANAIVGVHFDSQSIPLDKGHFATGVVCVGTAVTVKPSR